MNSCFIENLIADYPALAVCRESITQALQLLISCYEAGGKLLCCGNGGSSADCAHLTGELMKGFLKKRPLMPAEKERFGNSALADGLQRGLPAVSLPSQTAVMTAFINDCNPDYVYAQQVYALARERDLLLVFSTSGNSANIVYALEAAAAKGIASIAITGESAGKCGGRAGCVIKIPARETYRIQELTLPVYHCLAAAAEDYFFSE